MKFDYVFNHSGEVKKYSLLKAKNDADCIEGDKNMEVISQTMKRTNTYTTNIPDLFLYEVHVGDYIVVCGKSDIEYASHQIQTFKIIDITDREVIAEPY